MIPFTCHHHLRLPLDTKPSQKLCLVDTAQLGMFIDQINTIRHCSTPGCKGSLTQIMSKSKVLGGSMHISYVCSECMIVGAYYFETLAPHLSLGISQIDFALQVAFIINGSTYASYKKHLLH